MRENTKGAAVVLFAYVLWGILPVYWKALASVDSFLILAHRVVWSCVFSLLTAAFLRRHDLVSAFRAGRRSLMTLMTFALSGAVVSLNWCIYIWAVNDGRILESSLGYFVNPLISIVLGVAIFKEHLRKTQWLAVGIAALGFAVEVAALGRLPLVSLGLALSFGIYGLLKKISAADSIAGMAAETLFVAPFALAWLLWNQGGTLLPYDVRINFLLMGTGVITSIPLMLFAWGVKKSTMTTVGIVQYASPVLMFLLATLVYHEPVRPVRLLSFVLTWAGILLFAADSFRHGKKTGALV